MTFQLDTLGVVHQADPQQFGRIKRVAWADLTPFQQGYVGGLFDTVHSGGLTVYGGAMSMAPGDAVFFGFRHLAPATLGRIVADCSLFCERTDLAVLAGYSGADFWTMRQKGLWPAYPRLTVSLGDDGLVYLTEGVGK